MQIDDKLIHWQCAHEQKTENEGPIDSNRSSIRAPPDQFSFSIVEDRIWPGVNKTEWCHLDFKIHFIYKKHTHKGPKKNLISAAQQTLHHASTQWTW